MVIVTAEQTVVRLDSPAAIIASVPAMLGFAPENSIVVVMCSNEGGRTLVGPLMRLDSDRINDLAWYLRQYRAQHPQYDRAIVITYETALHEAEKWAAASCAVARDAGFDVKDALATAGGRWRSILCANPQCCPPDGNELPADEPTATALRANRIGSGQVTVATRAELEALVEPAGEQINPQSVIRARTERDAAVARDGASVWRTRIISRLAGYVEAVAHGATPHGRVEDTPALLDALSTSEVRDAVCGWAATPELRSPVVDVMLRLARASEQHVVDALCVAALHAYADGNGALANVCLHRAYRLQPDHTLTNMLSEYVQLGGHPSGLTRVAEQLAVS